MSTDKNLEIVFSDDLLSSSSAKAAYSPSKNILFVSRQAFRTQAPDVSTLHEVVHARIWSALRKESPVNLNGLAYNDLPELDFGPYGRGFGIDEVVATHFSLKCNSELMIIKLQEAILSSALNAYSVVS